MSNQSLNYLPNQIIADQYQLIAFVARGGMSSNIWKATDLHNKMPVILKIIDFHSWTKEQKESLNTEIIATKAANNASKCFCEIYNYFWIDSHFCIVQEYVDGINLLTYLQNHKQLVISEALYLYQLIIQALSALHTYHQNQAFQILHRDLKLSNIMISADGLKLRIIDLGIASILNYDRSKKLVNVNVPICASWGYVPPEIAQIRSHTPQEQVSELITEYWDLYAAGVILYNMLTGTYPYVPGESHVTKYALKARQFAYTPLKAYLPNVPLLVEQLIYRSLVSDPKHLQARFKSAQAILALWDQPSDFVLPESNLPLENVQLINRVQKYQPASINKTPLILTLIGVIFLMIVIILWL